MIFIDHLKIIYKIALIVGLQAIITAGAVGFATSRMRTIDDAYSDLISRVDKGAATTALASRESEGYVSTAYQLVAETTEEGNASLLRENSGHREKYETMMSEVLRNIPEKAENINRVISKFGREFAACDPLVKLAASVTSSEDNAKVATQIKSMCKPQMHSAIEAQGKLTDELVEYSFKASESLTEVTNDTIRTILVVTGFGLLLGLISATYIGLKGLSHPIRQLKIVMEAFASNDLTHDVPGVARRDELGDMAKTVEVFKTHGLEVARMREEQQAIEFRAAQQRKSEMLKLASYFEGAVGKIIQTVSSSATELEASANTLTATASRNEQLSTVVASAAEEASTNVQSVAAASEEMSSSVNEISRQVQESARIAGDAVSQAEKTNDRVSELSESANKIGDIVKLISTIAEQTNLLALNATIEAARAGEAGRGFAVVASEVKALAEQTSRATGEIGNQVAAIQAATLGSVSAIREISATIGRISEISSTIAAAVEEQGTATQEIARNVQQAAQGTTGVAANISELQRGSTETGSACSHVLSSAQSLSVESNRLKTEVSNFLSTVRAA